MRASNTLPAASPASPAAPTTRSRLMGLALPAQIAGVLVLSVLPYINGLTAFWVGDDYNYVVPKSFDTILNFFNPVGRAQYRPFNWLSWVFDYTLYGPNPPGWHITQLAMHLFCTLMIVLLLRDLARGWWPGDAAAQQWVPLVAGALYGVHPAHPEAVTWIGGRADVPFAVGLFLAAWALARWRTGGRRQPGYYLLAVVGTWLSLLGKEAGLVTPLALLLVDWAIPDGPNPPAPFPYREGGDAPNPPAPFPAREGGARLPSPYRGGVGGEVVRALANGVARVGLFAGLLIGPVIAFSLGVAAPTGVITTWERLTPLALLLVGLRWPRTPAPSSPGAVGRLVTLLRDHVPFLALAGAYAGLRVGLYLVGQGRLMYGPEAYLRFQPGTLLDAAVGYLLVGLGAWEAPQQLGAWPVLLKLGILVLAVALAVWVVRRLGRPALFALLWIPATVLITVDTATDRWFYVPSFGVCLLAALVLYRVAQPRPWVRTALAGALVMIWGVTTVLVNTEWAAAGAEAQGIIAQIRALHSDPPRPATFYMANPPYSYEGVLLFNSGFSEAPSFAYQDYVTVRGYELQENAAQVQAALADPRQVGPHPVFLRYEQGRLVEYPSLAALVAAQGAP